ncbi:hypothetical protein J2767_004915 [Agrobacterium tumefaciens]|nr:hypothetical protein [Agrobacterium tumefaciens]
MRKQIELLEHHADITADMVCIVAFLAEFGAIDGNLALLDFLKVVDASDQGRLSRSGGATQNDMFAPRDIEVDALQHLECAIPLVDTGHLDGFFRHAGPVHGQFPFLLSGFRCDFKYGINLDRRSARQRSGTKRGADMAALVSKYLDEEIGSTINDSRMPFEIGWRIYETAQLQAGNHPVQIAVQRSIDARYDIECAKPGCLITVAGRDILADDTDKVFDAIYSRYLTRNEQQISRHSVRNVIT